LPLAYLILAHQNPSQIGRLLDAIWSNENFYAIHIDKKSPLGVHQAVAEHARKYSNVEIIRPRAIHWGGWSMVQATLDAITLLARQGPWTHFINLSGQDHPLKSQSQIVTALSPHPDQSFLETKEVTEIGRLNRLNFFHLELPKRVYRLPIRRDIRRRWSPYWGSQWFILHRALAEFSISAAAGLFRRYFRHTAIPDEFFFPTLAMNSEFRTQIIPQNLRYIDWPLDSAGQLAHHPRTLDASDLPKIFAARDHFFARKFADENLLDELDRRRNAD
jgi:hypothetical protein